MSDGRHSLIAHARSGSPGELALRLSSTRDEDLPLAAYDVAASQAHVDELVAMGLLTQEGGEALASALAGVASSIEAGTLEWRDQDEDVHMNVEAAVAAVAGEELAGQLQAGRSRNEEIVTDERMWLRDAAQRLDGKLLALQRALVQRATNEVETPIPAHTHTQPAQPVLLAHHLLAYVEMLERDRGRLTDAAARANHCPAGSGAVAGSGLAIDRQRVAARLGFSGPTANSIDAISDRDYAMELVSACAIAAGHLSRMAGELVLWSTPYLGFARMPDAFASGSSMLPNKRNPDAAELVRARAARAEGTLAQLLSLVRGLPLAYHRDFQETRGPMLQAVADLELSLDVVTALYADVTFDRAAMRRAAGAGHSVAVALAERLVRAGVPFRTAHGRIGDLVAAADQRGCDLAALPDEDLRRALPELAERPNIVPTLEEAIAAADVPGGTAPNRVRAALEVAAARLGSQAVTA